VIAVAVMKRKLKAGMVGGGRDAFIGGVHRMAMRLDGKIDLVAGAFSSDPQSRASPARICFWIQNGFMRITAQWRLRKQNCPSVSALILSPW
jgi:hypothetical protein